MTPARVVVFPSKYVYGWPKADDDRAAIVDVADVLTQKLSTDVHFTGYAADVARRVTSELLNFPEHADKIADAGVRMTVALFDVDGPGHEAADTWRAAEKSKVVALLSDHPAAFVYLTRGGYRVVYALPEPVPLRSSEDEAKWTALYLSWLRYLARRYGIKADAACADWTHLFRAPHATRDGELQELPTLGDAAALGAWAPKLAASDRVQPKRLTSAEYGAVQPVPISDPSNAYGMARITTAVRYLATAPLSIKHEGGRDTMFSVCLVLMRRMRLPLEIAADLLEEIYCPRLVAAGTSSWSRDQPGAHGGCIVERLTKARDTGTVPPGDVMTEDFWTEITRTA